MTCLQALQLLLMLDLHAGQLVISAAGQACHVLSMPA